MTVLIQLRDAALDAIRAYEDNNHPPYSEMAALKEIAFELLELDIFPTIFEMPKVYETEEYESMSLIDLAIQLKTLKNALEEVGDLKTAVQKAYDHLSMSIVPDRMDEEGIETTKFAGVGRLQCSSDLRCSVKAKNREPLKNWLIEHGHGALVSETINSSTLKAFVREQMKENKEIPTDLLDLSPFTKASVVKA